MTSSDWALATIVIVCIIVVGSCTVFTQNNTPADTISVCIKTCMNGWSNLRERCLDICETHYMNRTSRGIENE